MCGATLSDLPPLFVETLLASCPRETADGPSAERTKKICVRLAAVRQAGSKKKSKGTRHPFSSPPPPPLHVYRVQAPKARERAAFSSTNELEGLPKLPSFGVREHSVKLLVRFYIAHEAVLRRLSSRKISTPCKATMRGSFTRGRTS